MDAETIIIQNAFTMIAITTGVLIGSYQNKKEDDKSAKFNWSALLWIESAIIAGSALSWVALV